MSKYKNHVTKWQHCDLCDLCESRRRVVFVRGSLPCDVLFVGEAPGSSEDLLGKPFVGPAGKLLDKIIRQGLRDQWKCAMTNLVGCIPVDETGKGQPTVKQIQSCSKKLVEVIRMADPSAIVCVGRLSEKHCPPVDGVVVRGMLHPAAILRMDVSQQGLAVQRCVVTLQDLAAELPPF